LDDIPWGQYCRSGCGNVAKRIKDAIGGTIHKIVPSSKLPGKVNLGLHSGKNTEWFYHQVVVKNGRVYDALTGPKGLPIDEFKKLWENADVIVFGF